MDVAARAHAVCGSVGLEPSEHSATRRDGEPEYGAHPPRDAQAAAYGRTGCPRLVPLRVRALRRHAGGGVRRLLRRRSDDRDGRDELWLGATGAEEPPCSAAEAR